MSVTGEASSLEGALMPLDRVWVHVRTCSRKDKRRKRKVTDM